MSNGAFIIGFTPQGSPVYSTNSPGVTKTIPSYLYALYQDDDDLQAFVAEQNNLTQSYVDWFNQIGLPIYTGPLIVGYFLDWVSQGLYGYKRPVGMSDDILKRALTWHFYKGDGKYFDVRWLKRRIMRFLQGVNGTDQGTSTTYDVNVTFGVGYHATVNAGKVTITGAVYNGYGGVSTQTFPNGMTQTLTSYKSPFLYGNTCYNGNPPTVIEAPEVVPVNNNWIITMYPFPTAPELKSRIDAKQLELPFQLQFTVVIA